MPTVLAISSHVATAGVGLNAARPALEACGCRVAALPTVVFGARPDLGTPGGMAMEPAALASALQAATAQIATLDGVLVGYVPGPEQAEVIGTWLGQVRKAHPQARILVDPVLGDEPGGLYVREETARAVHKHLLAHADITTPNMFELRWLTGMDPQDRFEELNAAESLGVPRVVITSAPGPYQYVSIRVVEDGQTGTLAWPRMPGTYRGVGDMFAGALLGYLLADLRISLAASAAADMTSAAIQAAAETGRDDLFFPGLPQLLAKAAKAATKPKPKKKKKGT